MKTFKIASSFYKKDTPSKHQDVGFIFTENAQMLGTNKNVSMTQAIIRTDKNGKINQNALPIITKKSQIPNLQWSNSDEDFERFKTLNEKLIKNILDCKYTTIVVPGGFATEKAQLPIRFAHWLQTELEEKLGIITELNVTKTGLITQSIKKSDTYNFF